ncbi:MAG TPA: outer membrane beta-barrel protein [bacterium]|nr:outer membrane beta-barrel protein [bacterium]
MKLRAVVIVFIAVFLFSGNLFAEGSTKGEFYAGAKIGPGAAFVYGDDADELDPAAGMSLGVFGTYRIIKFVGIQAEINYELKGFSVDVAGADQRQFLHYFSIPIMAKGFFPVSIVTIQPYFGFNISLLMSAKAKGEFLGATIEESNPEDYEVFDLGILFGTEAFIKITDHIFITADLRFDLGVLEAAENAELYNGTFYALFGAAYKF